MAWSGWFEFGGVEIINASRTEAYARHAGAGWFKAVVRNDDLVSILGDDRYDTPLQDDAPWVDPDDPDSFDFYGAYPIEVAGVENSTSVATVVESTLDGGVVGRQRHASRSMVFSVLLVGGSDCAVESGMRWLKAALQGGPCNDNASVRCGGADLCYLACTPCIDWAVCSGDPTECLAPIQRHLRKVAATVGPVVTRKSTMRDGGAAWLVSFTLVAGNPFEFGSEVRLIHGFMNPFVEVPYVGGVVPDGGSFDADGFKQQDPTCATVVYQPLFDPLCPAILTPPAPPSVDLSCFSFPVNYIRRQFTIPAQYVTLWGDMLPVLQINSKADEIRSLRLRFYTNPTGSGDPNEDPCSFCGDIVFSYIPPNSTLIFDASDRQVYIQTPGGGGNRRADSLVFGSDGGPFSWPELTCGIGYTVTIDLPQNYKGSRAHTAGSPKTWSIPPVINLSLYPRAS